MENMIDFDYSKQVADMWRINRAIGRCLECRDAERNKILRRKKHRSEMRKNDFRAAKRRYDFCVSKGINDKKMSETSMKKGFRHGSYHDNSGSHYAKNKNKAPSKNFSMSVYRREYDAKEKMTEYLYGLYEEKAERADTMSFWMEQDDGAIFYNELVDFIRQVCCATDEEISKIEKSIFEAGAMSKMLDQNLTLKEIAQKITGDKDVKVIDASIEPKYNCGCSKEKFAGSLVTLGEKQLKELIEEDEKAEIKCQFCNKTYQFNKEELEGILERAQNK